MRHRLPAFSKLVLSVFALVACSGGGGSGVGVGAGAGPISTAPPPSATATPIATPSTTPIATPSVTATPPNGTAVSFVGFTIGSGVDGTLTFARASPAPTFTLSSPVFAATRTYSAYVYENGTIFGSPQSLGSPSGNVLGAASPFANAQFPVRVQIVVEIVQN